jgi:hypothetical protein
LVEHAIENRSVGGSIPPLGTIHRSQMFANVRNIQQICDLADDTFGVVRQKPPQAKEFVGTNSAAMRRYQHMALTDVAIRKSKPRAKLFQLSDSAGLQLVVQPNGTKSGGSPIAMAAIKSRSGAIRS